MDPLLRIVILAVVQGVTEFLPISSSGHLVIVSALLAEADSSSAVEITDLNIMLHLGTLLSIAVFYWRRILALLGEDRRAALLVLWATLPAVIVGLPLRKFGEAWLESPLLAGMLLPVTGVVLLLSRRVDQGRGEYRGLSWRGGLAIGMAQGAAILPGISRSGTTITAGLACGLSRRSAATFSFLMALPVIAGAGVLEMASLALEQGEPATPWPHLLLGMAISFAVGLASLAWLIRWLEAGRLHWFAAWCFLLGAAILLWQLAPPAWN